MPLGLWPVCSKQASQCSTLIPIHPEQISQSSIGEIMVSFCQENSSYFTFCDVGHPLASTSSFPIVTVHGRVMFLLILDLVEASTSLRSHFTLRQTVQCQILFQLELPCNQRGVPEGALPRESALSKGTFCDGTLLIYQIKMGPKLSPTKESKEGCVPRLSHFPRVGFSCPVSCRKSHGQGAVQSDTQTSLYRFFECQRVLARVLCSQSHFPAKQ